MSPETLEIIGYTATIVSSTQLIPEIMAGMKSHRLKDVSPATLMVMVVSCTLWIIYSIGKEAFPLTASASLNATFAITLIIMRARYNRLEKLQIQEALAIAGKVRQQKNSAERDG